MCAAFAALELLGGLAVPGELGRPVLDVVWTLALLVPVCALALAPHGERIAPALLLAAVIPHAARLLEWPGAAWLAIPALVLGAGAPRVACVLAGLAGLLAPLAGLNRAPAPAPGDGPDVILITVDTLRADAWSPPDPDWWVADSAWSAAPWTLPAMHSLMRGEPVHEHGGGLVTEHGHTRPTGRPVARALQETGQQTAAFVSNPHLRAELGFAEGFDTFVHTDSWRERAWGRATVDEWRHRWGGPVPRLWHHRDRLLVDRALAWWDQAEPGRFLWVHLLLPHEYTRDSRAPPSSGPDHAYAANVAATNDQLTRLFALSADVLVVTSDHGESLGEDGRWGHGRALAPEVLQVPLAIRGCGGGRSGGAVALVDVHHTLKQGCATLPPVRNTISVGGTRDADPQFGWVQGHAVHLGDAQPAPAADQPVPDAVQRQLRALGYQDVP
jgi:hypothetical protein